MSKENYELKISDVVKDIKERLEERLGDEYYLCDLGMALTQSENCSGSWYCNSWKAEQSIKDNFDLIRDFTKYYKDNFGEKINMFDDTERNHCVFMIFLYENTFNRACWNLDLDMDSKTKISKRLINKIVKEMQNLSFDDIF